MLGFIQKKNRNCNEAMRLKWSKPDRQVSFLLLTLCSCKFYRKLNESRQPLMTMTRSKICMNKDDSILIGERGMIEWWKQPLDEHLNGTEIAGRKYLHGGNIYVRLITIN